MEFITHPFALGLLPGLVLAAFVAFSGWKKKRILEKEVQKLREHLHTHMSITARGSQSQVEEITELKKQNENLRVSVVTLKNRPDKSELQTLYLYDKAVHLMYEKAPGFASAWEASMKEAQAELDKTDTGAFAWVRKVVRPSLSTSRAEQEQSTSEEDLQINFNAEKKTPEQNA